MLTLSLIGVLSLFQEQKKVVAAGKLPENHTIQQLDVSFNGTQYAINVGNHSGTLLIRVDKPVNENDVEWLNWSRIKPLAVNFNLQTEKEFSKQSNPAPIPFSAGDVYDFKSQGEPDKWSKEAGIIRQGLLKFSSYDYPGYYIGLATYLPKTFSKGGIYYLRGNTFALREVGQVKAYFYEGQNLAAESYERINIGDTFPLFNKIMWGKTELKKGQLGKVTITSPTYLWKRLDNGQLIKERDLKMGEEFRVYRFLEGNKGLYGVGSGMYVQKEKQKVLYETPSKKNLRLVRILSGEE